MKSTHLFGGCLFWALFTVKLGIFWDFWPKRTHQEGWEPYIYIYNPTEWADFGWKSKKKQFYSQNGNETPPPKRWGFFMFQCFFFFLIFAFFCHSFFVSPSAPCPFWGLKIAHPVGLEVCVYVYIYMKQQEIRRNKEKKTKKLRKKTPSQKIFRKFPRNFRKLSAESPHPFLAQ